MPRAREKSSSGLSIELLDERPFYTPGSRIPGNVVLNTVEDFAIGSVNIEFYGRLKVFFVYSHGQGESYHRGRSQLFSSKQLLYEGYHTHKPGSFSWPFVFEIPTNPDISAVHESKHQWKEREHFLSTADYIPNHPMPPTFNMRKLGFGYRYHAYIEYVIRVDVKEAQGTRMVLPASSRKTTLPIMVKDVAKPDSNTLSLPLAVQFTLPEQLTEKTKVSEQGSARPSLQSQTTRQTVKSSRLTTWNRERGLSGSSFSFSNTIRDRTMSMLNSSTLPRYTFDITVSVPEKFRLLEERAVPIIVNAVPVQDHELTTVRTENYPDVRIDNITLELGVSTHIRFKSIFPGYKETRYDVKLLDRHPVDHTISMNASNRRDFQELNDGDEDKTASTQKGFDLSTLPGLSLALASAKIGKRVEHPLLPTFSSYIISREYTISWKLELDVAGEKVKVSSTDKIPVQILPPQAQELESLMQEIRGTLKSGFLDQQEDNNDNSSRNDDEEDVSDDDSTGSKAGTESTTSRDAKSLLKKFRSRRSKAQEAAEEAAQAQAHAQSEPPPPFSPPPPNPFATNTTTAGSNTNAATAAFQYQPPETLPTYQRNPTDFGYRHEIDERPPRYEAE